MRIHSISSCRQGICPTILLLLLLLVITVSPNEALPFSHYHSILSLSQSLTSRVANLRAARGDYSGAARARQISKNIERCLGMGFVKFVFSIGYDYVKNYSWRRRAASPLLLIKDLISLLSELIRLNSMEQRTAWLARNHTKLIRVSRSLIEIFGAPGSEVFEVLHKEVVEGELFKDCVEIGNNDFIAILKLLKDIANNYYSSSTSSTDL